MSSAPCVDPYTSNEWRHPNILRMWGKGCPFDTLHRSLSFSWISRTWPYTLYLENSPRYPAKRGKCCWRRIDPGVLPSLGSIATTSVDTAVLFTIILGRWIGIISCPEIANISISTRFTYLYLWRSAVSKLELPFYIDARAFQPVRSQSYVSSTYDRYRLGQPRR